MHHQTDPQSGPPMPPCLLIPYNAWRTRDLAEENCNSSRCVAAANQNLWSLETVKTSDPSQRSTPSHQGTTTERVQGDSTTPVTSRWQNSTCDISLAKLQMVIRTLLELQSHTLVQRRTNVKIQMLKRNSPGTYLCTPRFPRKSAQNERA